MVSTSAKYGWRAVHFYWIGAVPAMLFLALLMMPIYYRSKVRSVPEFLKVRFGEPTRVFNALSFAVLTVLVSGVGLYAMALILQVIFGWSFAAGNGDLGRVCACVYPAGRPARDHVQRGVAVRLDCRWVRALGVVLGLVLLGKARDTSGPACMRWIRTRRRWTGWG